MASESCCNAGSPVDSQYEGSGEIVSLGDVDCYCNGSREYGRGIVVIYDIFG